MAAVECRRTVGVSMAPDEVAAPYKHNDAGATDVRLVHGYCGADGREGIRAWALIGEGVVYDPIERRFYGKDAYYRALEVESQTVYTPQDAARLLRERDDFGPWSAPSPIGE